MTTITQQRLRGRPAHTPGQTYLTYTPDGKRLITAGSNDAIRVYTTGSDGEPVNIDDCQELNTAVVATNDFFVTGSEDGTVCVYSLKTNLLDKVLVRCTLPVRDVALSPDGNWAAVASDELVVKVVNTQDMTRVIYLRKQSKPVKHLSFHPNGSYLAASCSDGVVYVYSLSAEEPQLVKKVDGLIRSLETDSEASSGVIWHPDGTALAAPTATRDIQVVSRNDWQRQRAFASGHMGDITALAWSPNGALLASASMDRLLLLWEAKTQNIIARYEYPNVVSLAWHPTENILSFTNLEGELFIYTDFVPNEHRPLLKKPLQPAPFIHEADGWKPPDTTAEERPRRARDRRGTPDSLDDILGSDVMQDEDDFIIDDDGAGYVEEVNGYGKRSNKHLDEFDGPDHKKRATHDLWRPRLHLPFQPGSTPWRGNRRYLCLNLIGCVWTVDQDTHNTVTVEFYDREYHRDFHFTDPFLYDKACLNDNGTLFSCPPLNGSPAMIFYRPHETWTSRADWRTRLPIGEDVTSISLSDSYIVVTTSTNYVRVFTLYGMPFRVYRQKSSPTVTCASWRDYVLTMGNGSAGGDGKTRLLYTIENVKRDEICQNEDIVALPEGAEIRTAFFSDNGDPCIYDSTGVLLILLHWRSPGQARWVPVLDTTLLDRLAGGRKEESYWPVAVAQDKFHCIILKGGEKYPYFPRPLLSEFDLKIPLSQAPASDEEVDGSSGTETAKLEESYVRNSIVLALLEDLLAATTVTHSQRTDLALKELEVDKVLLQLLAVECREGEERGEKALEIVGLMRDQSGKMIEAAGKVANRYGRNLLQEKIRELGERKLLGMGED
ncbi:MAG: WD repeat and HMG-box DNA binding-domain containing protein 1 [Geoglossum simile]|nr:MAG: WD repeat and HMG-box DNA binding-domain containing protein 1 [Geoglossum simile]